jgi:hypothetical protein
MEVFKAHRTLHSEPIYMKSDTVSDDVKSAQDNNGSSYPAQICGDKVCIIADIKKGDNEFTFSDKQIGGYAGGVKLVMKDAEKRIDFILGSEPYTKPFTSYNYSDEFVKPFLGEVFNSQGESFTRLDFETKEHPHHRSVFLGVGDVNGIDFWNEPADRGSQKHVGFRDIVCGTAFAKFTADNVWLSVDNVPMIDESRTFTIYNQSEEIHCIDVEITFTATYKDITFGATKEAGPLGIRMNEKLRADKGTGHMINSYGAVGESECWGRSAQWCDYSGILEGRNCGITVFDNEQNERYPTAWHIRDYGLFAANNLFFKGGFDIPKGDSVTYKYRIWFYEYGFDHSERFVQYANNER